MKQGEIWAVDFNPTKGNEINKICPCVVIDDNSLASEHMRLVVPITSWQENKFGDKNWIVKIVATANNGLNNDSAAKIQQARFISTIRKIKMLSVLEHSILDDI